MERIIYKLMNVFVNRPLLKLKLNKYGKNFKIGYRTELRNPKYFSFGDNFFSGPYGYFVTNKHIPVSIGNHVMFGPFCKIFGGDHDVKYDKNHIRFAPEKEVQMKSITVEDGVWIGANTTILTNAFISEGAVVSCEAVVNNYIPPYCIAYGTPAKKIKRRFDNTQLRNILKNVNGQYSFSEIIELYNKYNVLDL